MGRNKIIIVLVVFVVIAAVVLTYELLPKRHLIAQTMPQAAVFWHDVLPQRAKIAPAEDREPQAFLFLNLNTTGRVQNVVQRKLSETKYGFLWSAFSGLEGYIDFSKQDLVAYHLLSNGDVARFQLPEKTTMNGFWGLVEGQLELAPWPAARDTLGFRWDGEKFVSVSRPRQAESRTAGATKLDPDDEEDEGPYSRFLSAESRRQLKSAGWHYKFLNGYNPEAEATLPIALGANTFNLTIESIPFSRDSNAAFDPVGYGFKSISLSGDKFASGSQVLWERHDWHIVSNEEYERLKEQAGYHGYPKRLTWLWLAALLLVVALKFSTWFRALSGFGTVKRRVLSTMATSYSFPPATSAQFPSLDLEALDRYTREMERMGFTRLLDCSPTSDSPHSQPSFSRIFAHTRHHCWGVINQMFPRGKKPMPMKCGFESCLQNGWTISFSDRKPIPASSLVRRKKALAVSMPEATTSDLLQAFLKMREQVCVDLGISAVNDDSLEAYIRWIQRAAGEMRDAVEQKSFVRGLPEVYLRRFTLLKTKPEYVWLGDYPKEGERRKQGFSAFATDTR